MAPPPHSRIAGYIFATTVVTPMDGPRLPHRIKGLQQRAGLDPMTPHQPYGFATTESALGVSDVTIRKDLQQLEDQGYLTRVRGGAVCRRASARTGNVFDKPSRRRSSTRSVIATAKMPSTALLASRSYTPRKCLNATA